MLGNPDKSIPAGSVELLFVAQNVWLHPSSSKKDNVAGFLALTKGANASNVDVHIAFVTRAQLLAKDIKIYENFDKSGSILEDSRSFKGKRSFVSKPSSEGLSTYTFNVPFSFIHGIQLRRPSFGFWHGSIIIFSKSGERLPIVFFHDESSGGDSVLDNLDNNETFDWQGERVLNAIRKLVPVEKTQVDPSLFLINPGTSDLINFAPYKANKSPQPKKPTVTSMIPDLNKTIAQAKWKILETVATFTARSKNQMLEAVDANLSPQLKQILKLGTNNNIANEFDSARVYLAKWALQVKQEAENSQLKYMLDENVYNNLNNELQSDEYLTTEEISKAARRKPVSKTEWDSFFDHSGRLSVVVDEVKDRVFHGGLEDSVRAEAWPFLLNLYPWTSSKGEREVLMDSFQTTYDDLKKLWINDEDKRSSEFWIDQKHRIEKDIHRTDRQHPLFKSVRADDLDPDEVEDVDISNITNPHLYRMREILLAYNEYNENLGYVQGMTDLLSPLYDILRDEALAFWAFANFMERMERNFVRDQSGMKTQMTSLNRLLQFMLPDLYKHLDKCDSIDLFFFFRMLLVWFKRELEWDDVLRLWEVLWTDYYSSQFHLFFALAILSDNERIMVLHLTRFDEVLKYVNDLSGGLKLDPLLERSEVLFLKFKRMIDLIDRNNDRNDEVSVALGPELRQFLSRNIIIQKDVPRPKDAGGG